MPSAYRGCFDLIQIQHQDPSHKAPSANLSQCQSTNQWNGFSCGFLTACRSQASVSERRLGFAAAKANGLADESSRNVACLPCARVASGPPGCAPSGDHLGGKQGGPHAQNGVPCGTAVGMRCGAFNVGYAPVHAHVPMLGVSAIIGVSVSVRCFQSL